MSIAEHFYAKDIADLTIEHCLELALSYTLIGFFGGQTS